MKKKITLLFSLFISIISFAQTTSNLIVFSEDGLKFYLILNGIRQNEVPVTNVKVKDLNQPYYSAKIIFEDKTHPDLDKKYLATVDQESNSPLEVTYKIKKNNKNVNVLRFFSQVPIAQAAPPSPAVQEIHYSTTPLPEISTTIITQETTTTNTSGTGTNNNVSVNVGGLGVNININETGMMGGGNVNSTTTTYSTTTTTTSSNTNANVNNTVNTNVQPVASNSCDGSVAMSNTNFTAAKQTITKQNFDDTKLTTAKQVLKSNCLTAAQIKEIMLLFTFEATRLDLAKMAHPRCVDKNNYFLLNDAFQFESSVEELNETLK